MNIVDAKKKTKMPCNSYRALLLEHRKMDTQIVKQKRYALAVIGFIMYLDDFQKSNGGCLLCKKKISDFSFIPANTPEGKIQLRIYSACMHGF